MHHCMLAATYLAAQVILMAGLQGVGKTTACGKLALTLAKQNKKVLLVATDVYRPAAIDQLKQLGQRVNAPVFELGQSAKPAEIARQGVEKANKEAFDAVIIDTAGRLQVYPGLFVRLVCFTVISLCPHQGCSCGILTIIRNP